MSEPVSFELIASTIIVLAIICAVGVILVNKGKK